MPDDVGEARGDWWQGLSDGELRERLEQHGVPGPTAAEWVDWRHSTFCEAITGIIGGEE
jgi:hypothetical protein